MTSSLRHTRNDRAERSCHAASSLNRIPVVPRRATTSPSVIVSCMQMSPAAPASAAHSWSHICTGGHPHSTPTPSPPWSISRTLLTSADATSTSTFCSISPSGVLCSGSPKSSTLACIPAASTITSAAAPVVPDPASATPPPTVTFAPLAPGPALAPTPVPNMTHHLLNNAQEKKHNTSATALTRRIASS